MAAFEFGVGYGSGEVRKWFEAVSAVGLLFEQVAGDAVEEGGDVLDLLAFLDAAGEAGEGIVGERFGIDGVFPNEDADEAGAEILVAQGGLVAIRMERGE